MQVQYSPENLVQQFAKDGGILMDDFASLGLMLVLAFAFPVFPLLVSMALPMVISMMVNALYNIVDSFFVARISEQAMTAKRIPYECGVDTIGKTRVRFHIGYFMYALVFLLFDVETIFLYPWAVKYGQLGLFALCEMLVFVGILAIGLWYAWKKGALSWK